LLTLGNVQRSTFVFAIGAILLALYVSKLRLLMRLLRTGTLRIGPMLTRHTCDPVSA
jgi:hypothetical protein